jgi:aminoglycoside phosphotransferase (APT) family kinase protein
MTELMERQAKPTPLPLSRQEILSLGHDIRSSLEEIACSEVPNVLGHLDFNPGNILVSMDRCIFLDWAEACVGPPFFTFQYLLERRRLLCESDPSSEEVLVSSYRRAWQAWLSARDVAVNLRATPLLAVFAYAAAGLAWRAPNMARRPETAGYLRSLVRRMKREAGALCKRRLVCLP